MTSQSDVVEKILVEDEGLNKEVPDFIMCIGDDSADEHMFTAM